MAAEEPDFATPTLMRAARGVYAQSIRAQLRAIGAEDLPRNGAVVLAGLYDGAQPDPPSWLGISGEALDRAVDALLECGYVTCGDDSTPRPAALELTARGREVIEAAARGVRLVDEQLESALGRERLQAARQALRAMAKLKLAHRTGGDGVRPTRPRRQLSGFSPIFPVRDLAAALAHYRMLGFETRPYADGTDYGFADRDGLSIHFAHDPAHDPGKGAGMAYLYVQDADALYAEWARPGIDGRTRPVEATEYGLREGSHVDLDGNLIRFGSERSA